MDVGGAVASLRTFYFGAVRNIESTAELLYKLRHHCASMTGAITFPVNINGKIENRQCVHFSDFFTDDILSHMTQTQAERWIRGWMLMKVMRKVLPGDEPILQILSSWLLSRPTFYDYLYRALDLKVKHQFTTVDALEKSFTAPLIRRLIWIIKSLAIVCSIRRRVEDFQAKMITSTDMRIIASRTKNNSDDLKGEPADFWKINASQLVKLGQNRVAAPEISEEETDYGAAEIGDEEESEDTSDPPPAKKRQALNKKQLALGTSAQATVGKKPVVRTPSPNRSKKSRHGERSGAMKAPKRVETTKAVELPKRVETPMIEESESLILDLSGVSVTGDISSPTYESEPPTPVSNKKRKEPELGENNNGEEPEHANTILDFVTNNSLVGAQYWLFPFNTDNSQVLIENVMGQKAYALSLSQMLDLGWKVAVVIAPRGHTLVAPPGIVYSIVGAEDKAVRKLIADETGKSITNELSSLALFQVLSPDCIEYAVKQYIYGHNNIADDTNILKLCFNDTAVKAEKLALQDLVAHTENPKVGAIGDAICYYCQFQPYRKWFVVDEKVVCVFCASGVRIPKEPFYWANVTNCVYYVDKQDLEAESSITSQTPPPRWCPDFDDSNVLLHNTKIVTEIDFTEPVLIKNGNLPALGNIPVSVIADGGTVHEHVLRASVRLNQLKITEPSQCAIGEITRVEPYLPSEFIVKDKAYPVGERHLGRIFMRGYVRRGLSQAAFNSNVVGVNLE